MGCTVRLSPGPLAPDAELRDFLQIVAGKGAIVNFVGVARPVSQAGLPLTGLYLDHYPGLTERTLAGIAASACALFPVEDVVIAHRCGLVEPEQPIVFVGAAAMHRRAAFLAADYLMDRLKTDAGFWKREDDASGSHWIEPTGQDRQDRERWSQPHAGN